MHIHTARRTIRFLRFSVLVFVYTLFIWQSIYICNSTDAFDLKNIVKFSRNEKELGGRGGGVLESKEDKKYDKKSFLNEEFRDFLGFGLSLNIIMQKGKKLKINTWCFFLRLIVYYCVSF